MHTLFRHICFFFGYLTNKLRIIWTFSGKFVFYSSERFFRLQFLAFLSGTTKRIHLFQNTVFIFVAYFLAVDRGGSWAAMVEATSSFRVASIVQLSRPSSASAVRLGSRLRAVWWISPKMWKRVWEWEERGRGWATKCLLVFITCSLLFGALRSLKLPSSTRKLFASDKWNWPRSQLGLSTLPPVLSPPLSLSLYLASVANYVINFALYRFKLNEIQPKLTASKYLWST